MYQGRWWEGLEGELNWDKGKKRAGGAVEAPSPPPPPQLNVVIYLPGSGCLRFRAKCVSCRGMYRVSARGGLRGAGGEALLPTPSGQRKARCSSQPTSRQMMLAFLKYGVTSRKNLTGKTKSRETFLLVNMFNCLSGEKILLLFMWVSCSLFVALLPNSTQPPFQIP